MSPDPAKALVIVANRLPIEIGIDGTATPSPGGLASALSAVAAEHCTWVGWSGATSNRRVPATLGGTQLYPVALTKAEADRYYLGFSNSVLWPLFHGRLRREEMNRSWWRAYRAINERFAVAVSLTAPTDATVWVHDYHLLLVPRLLRARRPDLRIGLFMHIPFPNAQLFSMLPWRQEVMSGMLGADLIGFQVADDVSNFLTTADRVLQVSVDGNRIKHWTRSVEVATFPISVDFAHWDELGAASVDEASAHRAEVATPYILLGIDRLDYTKGITQRLGAFEELLLDGQFDPNECTFVQFAVPSRSDLPAYQDERDDVETIVGRINARHRRADGSGPVHLVLTTLDDVGLAAWYRATDVMVVTSLADGMNLVAKEFVAARGDNGGVVVLSEFAGAAQDLGGALIVNPYDIEAIKRSLVMAKKMPLAERTARMMNMRDSVRDHDVHQWAQSFLDRLNASPRVGARASIRSVVTRVRRRVAARLGA